MPACLQGVVVGGTFSTSSCWGISYLSLIGLPILRLRQGKLLGKAVYCCPCRCFLFLERRDIHLITLATGILLG